MLDLVGLIGIKCAHVDLRWVHARGDKGRHTGAGRRRVGETRVVVGEGGIERVGRLGLGELIEICLGVSEEQRRVGGRVVH